MPIFLLPQLPYSIDALAPAISAETMAIHYSKHQKAYLDRVNKLAGAVTPVPQSLREAARAPSRLLAQAAAQAWNHEFFWRGLTPRSTKPAAVLISAIDSAFGSMKSFELAWKLAISEYFGAGWIWLVRNDEGDVEIVATPNEGMLVHDMPLTPLLAVDVWEHAYYLDYRADRRRYADALWELVNWDFVMGEWRREQPRREAPLAWCEG